MSADRRAFIASMGGAFMACGFRFVPSGESGEQSTLAELDDVYDVCHFVKSSVGYRDWLLVGANSKVTALTGRTEMGQGLTTVIVALVSQGMGIAPSEVQVVMGDTELCPDDGPTDGSSATEQVGWGFWKVATAASGALRSMGAAHLGVPAESAEYANGKIVSRLRSDATVDIGKLVRPATLLVDVEPAASTTLAAAYRDLDLEDVRAHDIVTGAYQYAGDLRSGKILYGSYQRSQYHQHLSKLESADLDAAKRVPGVVKTGILRGHPVVIGESYEAVQQGLLATRARWAKPTRPRQLRLESEIRRGAQFVAELENVGNPNTEIAAAHVRLSETYQTHFTTQAPLETDTAVADADSRGGTVWVGSQGPFLQRELVARRLRIAESDVHVVGMPVGGGYGGKLGNPVSAETAELSAFAGAPVKYVYSRADQFLGRGRAKEPCVIDISTGLGADGRIRGRHIDIINDEGFGTTEAYRVPASYTALYTAELPLRHATIRGTSYMQVNFAVESHMNALADLSGIDRVQLRINNVDLDAFRELLAAGAEMCRWNPYSPPSDHGIGVSLIQHGGRELGAFFVKVHVDRNSGQVTVQRVWCALDIGTVINRRNAIMGVRGAIMWGIGYCLIENLDTDGHRIHERTYLDYQVPRFADTPEIQIRFMQPYHHDGPRGVGEMPSAAIAPAVSDAINDAVGVRLRRTPFTPRRVLAGLARRATRNGSS